MTSSGPRYVDDDEYIRDFYPCIKKMWATNVVYFQVVCVTAVSFITIRSFMKLVFNGTDFLTSRSLTTIDWLMIMTKSPLVLNIFFPFKHDENDQESSKDITNKNTSEETAPQVGMI